MWPIFKATLLLQLEICIPLLKCTYISSHLHNVIVLIYQYTLCVCIIVLGILGTVVLYCIVVLYWVFILSIYYRTQSIICYETLGCGTVWEVLLTLVTRVGSLLRAALGPKTRSSLVSLELLE